MAQRGTTWKTTASTVRALALATVLVGVGACSDDVADRSEPLSLELQVGQQSALGNETGVKSGG